MFNRKIAEEEVIKTLQDGTIIESYPKDQPYPSYLFLGWPENRPIHGVAADNKEDRETIVITAYEPAPSLWNQKFDKRRQ